MRRTYVALTIFSAVLVVQGVDASPGGVEDYLPYIVAAFVTVLFLVFISAVIFSFYSRIKRDRGLLDEERVEIKNQKKRLDAEMEVISDKWRVLEESELKWEEEQKGKLEAYKSKIKGIWGEWKEEQKKTLAEIEGVQMKLEAERAKLREERSRLGKDMDVVEVKLAEIEEIEGKWGRDMAELEAERARMDEEWVELEKQKAVMKEEMDELEAMRDEIRGLSKKVDMGRIEEIRRIIEDDKVMIEEDRRKVEEDFREIEIMWRNVESAVKGKSKK